MLFRPFSVSPLNGVLGVNESMQITVEFKPTTVGDHQGDLVIRYDTGEDLFTPYGHSVDEFKSFKNFLKNLNTLLLVFIFRDYNF